MNLGINTPSVANYNCQRKNSPSFGMAVLVDKKAIPVIKAQAMKLSDILAENAHPTDVSDYTSFWNSLNATIERQKENPVNIIIKKIFGRNSVKAVVVDSEGAEKAVKNSSFNQGVFRNNGDLTFLYEAEAQANKLNDANSRIDKFVIAEKSDYKPGAAQVNND